MVDFSLLLDEPAYETFGIPVLLWTNTIAPETLTGLDKMVEVSDGGKSGITIPTLRRAILLRLSELTEKGFDPKCLDEANGARLTIASVDYEVIAPAPTRNLREVALLIGEDP